MKDEPRIDGGPYHVEPDVLNSDAFSVPNRWRIVSDNAKERKLSWGTARALYVATVYSKADADFICHLMNKHSWNRHA